MVVLLVWNRRLGSTRAMGLVHARVRAGRSMSGRLGTAIICMAAFAAAAGCGHDGTADATRSGDDRERAAAPAVAPSPPDPSYDGSSGAVGESLLSAESIGAPVDIGIGLVVTVLHIRPVDVVPVGPGSTAGPGIAIDIALRNASETTVDLAEVAVTATGADGEVGTPVEDGVAVAAWGPLGRGEEGRGTYLFRLDGRRDAVTVNVFHGQAANVVVVRS